MTQIKVMALETSDAARAFDIDEDEDGTTKLHVLDRTCAETYAVDADTLFAVLQASGVLDDLEARPSCFLCQRSHDYHNMLLRLLYREFSEDIWRASWVSKPADPEITTMFIDWLRTWLVQVPESYEVEGMPHLQAAFRAAYGQDAASG